jgi:hypothetical protein
MCRGTALALAFCACSAFSSVTAPAAAVVKWQAGAGALVTFDPATRSVVSIAGSGQGEIDTGFRGLNLNPLGLFTYAPRDRLDGIFWVPS